jgi:hypothetical protein
MKGTVVEDAEDELGEKVNLRLWRSLCGSLRDSLSVRLWDSLWESLCVSLYFSLGSSLEVSLYERNRRGR